MSTDPKGCNDYRAEDWWPNLLEQAIKARRGEKFVFSGTALVWKNEPIVELARVVASFRGFGSGMLVIEAAIDFVAPALTREDLNMLHAFWHFGLWKSDPARPNHTDGHFPLDAYCRQHWNDPERHQQRRIYLSTARALIEEKAIHAREAAGWN